MKIFLLNYYWPPCGGPAVQRWLYIIKYLNQMGFECHVLTVEPRSASYPTHDESLFEQIPQQVKIYKTPATDFLGFYSKWLNKGKIPSPATGKAEKWTEKMARFIRSNFFLPDPRIGWNKYAYQKALQIINENQIKTIITAGPPHSTHLIGKKLKKTQHLFWIADLHDYWTNIAYLPNFYRTSIASWIDTQLEKSVLKQGDAILTHCKSSKTYFVNKYNLSTDKIKVHSIGFDEDLFSSKPIYEIKNNEFVISYTGTIAGFYSADAFFEALSLVIGKQKKLIYKFVIAGKTDSYIEQLPKKYAIESAVLFLGYQSHKESVEILLKSDALFLINPVGEVQKIHVPGKIYEYLAARKPIINLAPKESEVAQMIAECEAGMTFERWQIAQIADYITYLSENKINNKPSLQDNQNFKKYGRKKETETLAEWIKEIGS